jgi:cytochrome c oxidase cbb3-type subunit I
MLAFTTKPRSASLAFLAAGAAWFVVGTIYGLFSAIHLMAPDALGGIGMLVFGRTRPSHVNTMIFGFVAPVLVGCALYYVPALLRTPLWSERLGWASWLLWNITVASGPVCFAFGVSQGREYAEYTWFFDLLLVGSILLLIFNLTMTVSNRRANPLYVSVWYVLGAAVWTAGVYPIGNVMWQAPSGAMPGLIDSVLLWFYGHNLVGLLLTPLSLGLAYFLIPRVTRTPLYSHTLSLVGFWSLIALYSHIGGHHILQTPIPNWLKTISVVDSVAMIVPVFTVLANLWLTARGRSGLLWRDPGGRFVLVGTLWYLLVCIQGPIQSVPAVQEVTHFNNWVVGHAHVAVLGFAGFVALGGLWHILPLAARRQLYSARLVSLQWGLAMFGLVGFFVVLTAVGLIQGSAWAHGTALYRTLPELSIFMVLRAMLGVFILSSAIVGLCNLVLTLRRGAPLALGATDAPGTTGVSPAGEPAGETPAVPAAPLEGRP